MCIFHLGNGFIIERTAETKYASPFTKNDIIGCEFDFDTKEIEFFKNGVSQGVAFTNLRRFVCPAVSVFIPGTKISIPIRSLVKKVPKENGS